MPDEPGLQLKKMCRKYAVLAAEQLLTEFAPRKTMMAGSLQVGEWSFSPATATLSRGTERRRIENRAARVLELLCRLDGAPVTTQDLIEAVWDGRSVSPNSVAVVIGDLRRALDDDPREPRYIETIAKRGYRLLVPVLTDASPGGDRESGAPSPERPRRIPLLYPAIGAALLAALIGVGVMETRDRGAPRFLVTIAEVPNQTRDARYDALATAVGKLLESEVGRLPSVEMTRDTGGGIDAEIRGTLILWSGHPAVSLSAEQPATGAVLWSGMASGPEDRLPGQVRAEIAKFAKTVEPVAPRAH